MQALPPPGASPGAPPGATAPGPSPGQVRGLAILAAGAVSALCVLWLLRGMPLGTALMWLSPLPLLAAALAFGPAAAAMAAGLAAFPLLLLGNLEAVVAHGVAVGVPVVVAAMAALSVPPGQAPRLGAPVVVLALLAGLLWLVAGLALSGHPGGFHGVLRGMFVTALRQTGTPMDAAVQQLADLMARVVPIATGLWFLGAMALNAAMAQRLVNGFGMLARPPVLFAELSLPRWFVFLPLASGLATLLAPEGPRFVIGGITEILVIPFLLLGLCVVHALARPTASPRMWLGAFYAALLLFSAPVMFVVTAIGFADHFSNLRGRIAARANSRPPRPGEPPEDRTP